MSLKRDIFKHYARRIEDVIDPLNTNEGFEPDFCQTWKEMSRTAPRSKVAVLDGKGKYSNFDLDSDPNDSGEQDVISMYLELYEKFPVDNKSLGRRLRNIKRGGELRLRTYILDDLSEQSFTEWLRHAKAFMEILGFHLVTEELLYRQGMEFMEETGRFNHTDRFNRDIHSGITLIFLKAA